MESWTALTAALADRRAAHQDRERRVDRFLEQACPDWRVAGPAQAMAHNAALRLLRHDPGLAHENLYTAIVSGDVHLVERLRARRCAGGDAKGRAARLGAPALPRSQPVARARYG